MREKNQERVESEGNFIKIRWTNFRPQRLFVCFVLFLLSIFLSSPFFHFLFEGFSLLLKIRGLRMLLLNFLSSSDSLAHVSRGQFLLF